MTKKSIKRVSVNYGSLSSILSYTSKVAIEPDQGLLKRAKPRKALSHSVEELVSQQALYSMNHLSNDTNSHPFLRLSISKSTFLPTSPCTCSMFDSDGSFVLATHSSNISLLNAHSLSHVQDYVGHSRAIYCLALSPDRKTMLSGGADRAVYLWDTEQGKIFRRLHGHSGHINWLSMAKSTFSDSCVASKSSGSGSRNVSPWLLASASNDRTARVWDMRCLPRPVQVYDDAKDSVEMVNLNISTKKSGNDTETNASLQSTNMMLTSSVDGFIRLYDVRKTEPLQEILVTAQHRPVTSCHMNIDNTWALLSTITLNSKKPDFDHSSSKVFLWDMQYNAPLVTFPSGPLITNMKARSAVSSKELYVASTSEDGVVWLWDLLNPERLECQTKISIIEGEKGSSLSKEAGNSVSSISFHPEKDNVLLTTTYAGRVCILQLTKDNLIS